MAGSSRSSMISHQDHRFPGVEAGDGLKIDFDKDADSKRNAAHARDQKAQKSKEALRLPREVPGAPRTRAGTPSVSAHSPPGHVKVTSRASLQLSLGHYLSPASGRAGCT